MIDLRFRKRPLPDPRRPFPHQSPLQSPPRAARRRRTRRQSSTCWDSYGWAGCGWQLTHSGLRPTYSSLTDNEKLHRGTVSMNLAKRFSLANVKILAQPDEPFVRFILAASDHALRCDWCAEVCPTNHPLTNHHSHPHPASLSLLNISFFSVFKILISGQIRAARVDQEHDQAAEIVHWWGGKYDGFFLFSAHFSFFLKLYCINWNHTDIE